MSSDHPTAPRPGRLDKGLHARLRARLRRLRPSCRDALSGIRGRLVLLAVTTLVPLLCLIAYFLQELAAKDHREALARTLAAARIVAARADEHMVHIESLLVAVKAIVEPNLAAVNDNDRRLRLLQAQFPPHVGTIAVISVEGRIINSSSLSPAERKLYDFSDRPHFKRVVATPGLSFSDPLLSRILNEWCVIAYLPIYGREGKVVALASVSTRLEQFEQLLRPEGMPDDTVVTLVNTNDRVVARTRDMTHWVGRDLSRSRLPPTGPDAYSAIWPNADQVLSYGALVRTRQLGWRAYVGLPVATALTSARHHMMLLVLIAVLVTAFTALVALRLARSIVRPIRALSQEVERFGAGELDARCTPAGPREIAALARCFNGLAGQRQREELALRDSLERLRLIARAANIGLWDWDLATNVVRYSDEWKSQLGYAPHELTDDFATWEAHVDPEDRVRILALLERYIATPWADYEAEFRMRHKDGTYRHLFTRAALVYDAAGTPVRMLGCHIDVTKRKAADQRIADQLDELRRWQEVTLDREDRIRALKTEVNALLARNGRAARYPSALPPPAALPERLAS